MNTPVNFEIAKLLKEKGFPQLNQGLYYTKDKEHCLVGWGYKDHTENSFAQYSAPTIAEVVMWLYEKYGIWISPKPFVRIDQSKVWLYDIFKNNYIIEQVHPSNGMNTPTEAYESAIEYCLTNLI